MSEEKRKELEEKYKDYIGKYFLDDEGVVFKIEKVRYNPYDSRNEYCFEASTINSDFDNFDISFSVMEGSESLSKEEVIRHLGLDEEKNVGVSRTKVRFGK